MSEASLQTWLSAMVRGDRVRRSADPEPDELVQRGDRTAFSFRFFDLKKPIPALALMHLTPHHFQEARRNTESETAVPSPVTCGPSLYLGRFSLYVLALPQVRLLDAPLARFRSVLCVELVRALLLKEPAALVVLERLHDLPLGRHDKRSVLQRRKRAREQERKSVEGEKSVSPGARSRHRLGGAKLEHLHDRLLEGRSC